MELVFNKKSMEVENVFFTSDLHFGHKKIIEYCQRPFEDVDEMNEKLVENWNKVVEPNDYVFNLGDIVFGGATLFENYVSKLNGHHILIKGNHDYKNVKSKAKEDYFEEIHEMLKISVNGREIYLSHFPLLCWDGCYDGKVWNLHGHTHLGPYSTGIDTERMKLRLDWQIDVGVDAWYYKPVNFGEVNTLFKTRMHKYRNLEECLKDYVDNPEDWNY